MQKLCLLSVVLVCTSVLGSRLNEKNEYLESTTAHIVDRVNALNATFKVIFFD